MGKLFNNRTGIMFILLLAIAFPLVFADNRYVLYIMTTCFIFIIAVYGMNLLAGFTGQLSLAHAGFFAIGAYSVGILTTRYELNFWLALLVAMVITCVAGLLLGVIALRTREHFFAIYTLIVGYLIYLLIDKWDSLTGGVRGLIGIPVPDAIGPIEFTSATSMYYLVLFFLVISIFIGVRIVHSLTGRTYIAIRNSEELAQTLGINTRTNKLVSFVVSIAYAGLAGGLYASLTRFIGPEIAGLEMVFNFLIYLIVGGLGTLTGPIVGTMIFVWLTQFLQSFQEYRMLIFGPILVMIVIFYPAGLAGAYFSLKIKFDEARKKRATKQEQKNSLESSKIQSREVS
ncbi:branched-chain amino acid ABC transporter permease [Sporosarcina pasteurii]|uniref:Leucine/isoleucine/valine transporter permease subunit n=1 Tax=Sporosarcina pasteurii TaxID=1474 RepID=A0A380C3P4_SPOPA|nr:branched-chain amino acid ABC transporter permease [Sporosarcina pasteurii]MDS9471577.1 branched-chain amino acid ABC transporter permease [Sporosarcina pasteurii]QBQ04808.1 branched-chain amino acid ABC transporter permease [Sporosarcina pasteurii]SUJ11176.1 leucine/isoleucine/valine transporter permease subunit [Sporosarcina pasteurii]